MTLFELSAVLSLDADSFNSGVASAEKKIGTLKNNMSGLGSGNTGSGLGNLGEELQEGARTQGASAGSLWGTAFGTAMGQTIGNFAGKAVDAVFDFATEGVQLASQMQEVENVVDVTFGRSASEIYMWAGAAKEAFGMSTSAALEYAGQMGSVLKGQGFATEQAADMSMALVGLAADFASFKNMSFEEAFGKLSSGMRGETEAIEAFGISMHEKTMQEWWGKQGADKAWKDLSEAEKYAARYKYIMERSEDMGVVGDFDRNKDTFANQVKIFQTNLEELKTSLGETLLPVMNQIVTFFNTLFGGSSTQSAEEFGTAMTKSLGESYAQIQATSDSAIGLINAMIALEEQGIDTDAEQSQWNALMEQLQESVSGVNTVLGDQVTSISACKTALIEYIEQWRANEMEMAGQRALQNYYDKMSAQAEKVVGLETDLYVERAKLGDPAKRYSEIIEAYRSSRGLAEDLEDGFVVREILLEGSEGKNLDAVQWANELAAMEEGKARVAALESELSSERGILTDMQSDYLLRMEAINEIMSKQGLEADGGGGAVPETINLTINIEGSAVMDGKAVGHLMMPQINAEIRRQANAQMHVR